jgi:hypothetical protein
LPSKAAFAGAAPSKGRKKAAEAADGEEAAGPVMDKYRGVSVGNVIDCEGGSVVVPSYFSATAYDRAGKVVKEFKGSDRHMQNFIDCVRSRKAAQQYGPILDGHLSSALCHLGNISHLLGQATAPDALRERIKGNALLTEAYGRMGEHLLANAVDTTRTPLTLGVPLQLAPGREAFTGEFAAQANPLLTRQYRAPFAVPALA